MTVKILENGWITDNFQMGEGTKVLVDAIVLPPDEYNKLTKEQLDQMKKDRYDKWLEKINEPPIRPVLKNS